MDPHKALLTIPVPTFGNTLQPIKVCLPPGKLRCPF